MEDHIIRKGTTVQVNWALNSITGPDFSLEGYTTRLYFSCGSNRSLATGVAHDNNVLSWTFSPAEQWKTGEYDLQLELYYSGTKVITIEYPKAFTLLSEYGQTPSQTTAEQTVDTTINIASSCDIYRFAPVVPVINTTDGKWYVNGTACEDAGGNPIYAYPTLDIEEDGTIVINKDRHNEVESDVIKDFIEGYEVDLSVNAVNKAWLLRGVVIKDTSNNPVYSNMTIYVEEDGTIVINKGRHDEYSNTALKDFMGGVDTRLQAIEEWIEQHSEPNEDNN